MRTFIGNNPELENKIQPGERNTEGTQDEMKMELEKKTLITQRKTQRKS